MPHSFSVNSSHWLLALIIKPMKFSMITGNLTTINLVAAFLLVFLTSQAVSQNCKFHVFHKYNARSAFMHIRKVFWGSIIRKWMWMLFSNLLSNVTIMTTTRCAVAVRYWYYITNCHTFFVSLATCYIERKIHVLTLINMSNKRKISSLL